MSALLIYLNNRYCSARRLILASTPSSLSPQPQPQLLVKTTVEGQNDNWRTTRPTPTTMRSLALPNLLPKHIRRPLTGGRRTECIRGSRDDPQFTTKMTAFDSNSVSFSYSAVLRLAGWLAARRRTGGSPFLVPLQLSRCTGMCKILD